MKVLSISIAAYNVAYTLKECLDPFLKSNVLGNWILWLLMMVPVIIRLRLQKNIMHYILIHSD